MNAPVQTAEAREIALAGMGASRLRKEDVIARTDAAEFAIAAPAASGAAAARCTSMRSRTPASSRCSSCTASACRCRA